MNSGKLVPMIIGILFMLFSLNHAFIVRVTESHYNKSHPVEPMNAFRCDCKDKIRTLRLAKGTFQRIVQSLQGRTFCTYEKSGTRICKWVEECNNCTGLMESCKPHPMPDSGYYCTKRTFEMNQKYLINLKPEHAVENAPYGPRSVTIRKIRQASTCPYPMGMKTASLSLLKYPSSISATLKCIFGYTFKEGISRQMKCSYSEGIWKPAGFEECEPFIDCTISLKSTGWVECTTPSVTAAPKCNVTCDYYEDMDGVPQATYECNISGDWKPKLPFCASSGTGLHLVSAPGIKLHSFEDDLKPKITKKLKPKKKFN